ncbi:fimbrial protein [Escherichia coli]|uniref:fimbrial protein n=1 Tax=Escherichia coli TaxID=562 RepID=UPI0006A60D32|nr:fimbrial protein [Escherichia coli]EIP7736099.1 type 1 fimbrial protein [Escherichia coli]EIP8028348.1 type 1 fimbrial protein [Escherichia coli]MZR38204.1 fimbrial protein [Escherichia coli]HBM9704223.1 type 1 fimbrial protein [Escherichia coli]
MKRLFWAKNVACLTGCLSLLLTLSVGAVNVSFNGELLDRPCQVDPASDGQTVRFLERPVKDFQYAPGRGPEEDFSIRLIQCNTSSVWKTVKLKLSGDKETAMKERADYFLKVTGVNSGKLAIGILDTDGTTLMKLGDAHNRKQGTPINSNTLLLNFKAYVQATPDALAQKSVTPGTYYSTANFELFYE